MVAGRHWLLPWPGHRLAVSVLFVVVTGSLACAAYALWYEHRVIIDDAFISYRYARHWVDGQGVVYNPGERVQGYSNFLWMALAAGALLLRLDPLAVTQALGVASFLGGLWLSGALAWLARPRSVKVALPAAVALLFYVLPHGFAALAGTGLETSFLGLVLLAMGVLNHFWPPRHRGLRALACLLPLLAVLTRLDAVLAVGASGFVYFASRLGLDWRQRWRAALRSTLARFGPAVAGLLGLLGWQLWYYGSIFPNTYFAKGAEFVPMEVGVRYVVAFLRHSPWVLFLAPFGLWGGLWARLDRARAFGAFALLALGLHTAYVVKVGGDFMQYRFMWEVVPLFIGLLVVGLRAFPSPGFALVSVLLAVPFATVETHLEGQHGMHEVLQMNEYTRFGVRVGTALSRLPHDTLVATTLAGTVGYYSRLPVLDEWGLNDRYVAHLQMDHFAARGHVKQAPLKYLEQRQVNLRLGHPVATPCDQPSQDVGPVVAFRLGSNECVRLGYVRQTPRLTDFLCHAPEVIRYRLACPGR